MPVTQRRAGHLYAPLFGEVCLVRLSTRDSGYYSAWIRFHDAGLITNVDEFDRGMGGPYTTFVPLLYSGLEFEDASSRARKSVGHVLLC